MPELPEVEVVRLGLSPAVTGSTVTSVDVLDDRALTRHVLGSADFTARLRGTVLAAPRRRGKFLWIPLSDRDDAMLAHLGMSGQLLLRDPNAPRERHERIRIILDQPEYGEVAVIFADQRTFGSLAIDTVSDGLPAQAAHIARDPLDPAFDVGAVVASIRRSRSAIKRTLLDQRIVSGIGNIYADESLWAARVHPENAGNATSVRAVTRTLVEAEQVMLRALAEGGTSFDAQYVNVNGQSGYFSRSLHAYGREGLPCARCGTVIRRVSFMNRSSFFCPRCQRR